MDSLRHSTTTLSMFLGVVDMTNTKEAFTTLSDRSVLSQDGSNSGSLGMLHEQVVWNRLWGSTLMWVIAAMTTRFLRVRAEFRVSEDLAHRCLTGQMKFKKCDGRMDLNEVEPAISVSRLRLKDHHHRYVPEKTHECRREHIPTAA